MGTRILLVDDEPAARAALHRLLVAMGHEGVLAGDGADALAKIQNESFDLCLTDADLPEGHAVLEAARTRRPPVPVVVLTGEGTVKHAVAALRAGAVDFLSKPFHNEILAQTLRRALGTATGSNDGPRPSEGATPVGGHPPIRRRLERIARVADPDANVLTRGEAGPGKEMIARLVHASSARRAGPFVAVNLADLTEAVADAELFGEAGRPGRILA